MVQTPRSTQQKQRIDWVLDSQFRRWSEVSVIAAKWDDWDQQSRRTYEQEWRLALDLLDSLQEWEADGSLTPGQRARYHELLVLVEGMRPLLKRMGIRQ